MGSAASGPWPLLVECRWGLRLSGLSAEQSTYRQQERAQPSRRARFQLYGTIIRGSLSEVGAMAVVTPSVMLVMVTET